MPKIGFLINNISLKQNVFLNLIFKLGMKSKSTINFRKEIHPKTISPTFTPNL